MEQHTIQDNVEEENALDVVLNAFDSFMNKDVHLKLYPYQLTPAYAIIESMVEVFGKEICMLFSRQSGKTEMIADVTYFLAVYLPSLARVTKSPKLAMFLKGVKIGIFAPKYDQARITFDRLKDRFDEFSMQSKGIMSEVSNGNTFTLSNGSLIKCLSASEGTTIEGETFHLLVVEECQDVNDRKLKKSIFPMGASTRATTCLIGTASFHKCYFWQQIERYAGQENLFLVHYKEAQKWNKNYALYIEDEKRRIGEDSDEFKSQYELQWILERGMFIVEGKFNELIGDYSIYHQYVPKQGEYVVAGVDWGKANDSTTVTIGICNGKKIKTVAWLELIGDDYADQLDYIIGFLKDYGTSLIMCDATATQDQIIDNFKRRCRDMSYMLRIEGMQMTAQGKDKIYKELLSKTSQGDISFPRIETKEARRFKMQMLDLEKEYKGNMLSCHHPDDKNAHDDFCDSLALMVWAGSKRPSKAVLGKYNRKKEMDRVELKKGINPMEEKEILKGLIKDVVEAKKR